MRVVYSVTYDEVNAEDSDEINNDDADDDSTTDGDEYCIQTHVQI